MSVLFLKPDSLEAALAALAEHGDEAKVLAGGTALVLMLRHRLIAPQALISLGGVPGLSGVEASSGGLRIGAMTRLREVAEAPAVRERYPALATACGVVGNVRVRNQATLGGNLAEADYASDPPTVLLALDAGVQLRSREGERTMPVDDFLLGFYTTVLEPTELVEAIEVPAPPDGARMTYLKYKSRSSEDRPCAGVAAVAAFDGEVVRDLRVAVGAACERPQRLREVEAAAAGEPLSDARIDEIADAYAEGIDTLEDLRGSAWYRKEMIRVHVRRALKEVRDGRG